MLLALADAKRRRRIKAVGDFEAWGTTTVFRLWHALHALKTLFCLKTKKGLTRNGTLWRIAPRLFLPSPVVTVPPLRIAGIVCEEIRWQIKKQ